MQPPYSLQATSMQYQCNPDVISSACMLRCRCEPHATIIQPPCTLHATFTGCKCWYSFQPKNIKAFCIWEGKPTAVAHKKTSTLSKVKASVGWFHPTNTSSCYAPCTVYQCKQACEAHLANLASAHLSCLLDLPLGMHAWQEQQRTTALCVQGLYVPPMVAVTRTHPPQHTHALGVSTKRMHNAQE